MLSKLHLLVQGLLYSFDLFPFLSKRKTDICIRMLETILFANMVLISFFTKSVTELWSVMQSSNQFLVMTPTFCVCKVTGTLWRHREAPLTQSSELNQAFLLLQNISSNTQIVSMLPSWQRNTLIKLNPFCHHKTSLSWEVPSRIPLYVREIIFEYWGPQHYGKIVWFCWVEQVFCSECRIPCIAIFGMHV